MRNNNQDYKFSMDYSVTPNVKKDNFVGGSSSKIPLTRNAHPTAPMVGKFIEIQD
jgi:hypothetical protein